MKMKNKTAAWLLLGGSLYLLWRFFRTSQASLSPRVKSRLPVAKNLPTILDEQGNYDMDGVSFDTNGVVVSGDGNKSQIPNADPSYQLH
jgi:hypothetical protein